MTLNEAIDGLKTYPGLAESVVGSTGKQPAEPLDFETVAELRAFVDAIANGSEESRQAMYEEILRWAERCIKRYFDEAADNGLEALLDAIDWITLAWDNSPTAFQASGSDYVAKRRAFLRRLGQSGDLTLKSIRAYKPGWRNR